MTSTLDGRCHLILVVISPGREPIAVVREGLGYPRGRSSPAVWGAGSCHRREDFQVNIVRDAPRQQMAAKSDLAPRARIIIVIGLY